MAVDRIRGSANIPLTEAGEQLTTKLGQRIRALGGLDKVYTSHKDRTLHTANAMGAPVMVNPALEDMKYGALEGVQSEKAIPIINSYIEHGADEPLPGKSLASGEAGESFNGFKSRVLSAFDGIMKEAEPGQKIGVVTNRRVIKTLEGWLDKKAQPTFDVNTDKVTSFNPSDTNTPGSVHLMTKTNGRWNLKQVDLNASDEPLKPGIWIMRHGQTPWNKEG